MATVKDRTLRRKATVRRAVKAAGSGRARPFLIAASFTLRRTDAVRLAVRSLNLDMAPSYFFLPSLRKMYSPAYFTPLPL